MCWDSNKLETKIADKDIQVFKIVNWNNTSVYQDFHYETGKEYESYVRIEREDWSDNEGHYTISQGIHSYNSRKVHVEYSYKDYFGNICSKYFKVVGNNMTIDYFVRVYMRLKCVDCVIPKGATYYENEQGEIVSNRLIYNKTL